jgi:hypothetical protein
MIVVSKGTWRNISCGWKVDKNFNLYVHEKCLFCFDKIACITKIVCGPTSYHRNIRLIRTWHSLTLKSATHHQVAGSCEATMPYFLRHRHYIDTNQKQNALTALIPSGCTVVFLLITKFCYTGILSCSLLYKFHRIKIRHLIMRKFKIDMWRQSGKNKKQPWYNTRH